MGCGVRGVSVVGVSGEAGALQRVDGRGDDRTRMCVGGARRAGMRHKVCGQSEVKADGRRESGGRREAGEWHKADRRHKAGERHTAGARPKSQGTCTKRAGRQETRFFVFRV